MPKLTMSGFLSDSRPFLAEDRSCFNKFSSFFINNKSSLTFPKRSWLGRTWLEGCRSRSRSCCCCCCCCSRCCCCCCCCCSCCCFDDGRSTSNLNRSSTSFIKSEKGETPFVVECVVADASVVGVELGTYLVGVDAVVAVTGVAVDDLNDEHQFLQSIKSEKIQQPN